MVFTFLVGGKAGYGVKKAAGTVAKIFSERGLHVFETDDYPSVIKGSHNFSMVSCAKEWLGSSYEKAQVVVCLDKRSYEAHKEHIAEGGVIIVDEGKGEGLSVPITELAKGYKLPELIKGVSGPACLCAAIGMSKEEMEEVIRKEYSKGVEENLEYAGKIYDYVVEKIPKFNIGLGNGKKPLMTGNVAIALGGAAAGLELYIAYPMTPSTSILHYLAGHDRKLGLNVVQPENEIAVANMAVGSVFAGTKTMVGTATGGFALMQEAFSLCGMSEAPVVFAVSSRPGPATGVPTYTGQGDLKFALNPGHGEFQRVVACPGTVEEAFYLASELMWLSWTFQTPTLLLTEKHMSESTMTVDIHVEDAKWAEHVEPGKGKEGYVRYEIRDDGISPLQFPPSKHMIKWTSYEHTPDGITTEKPDEVMAMMEKRQRKGKNIVAHLRHNKTVNEYGHQGGDADVYVLCWGSTTMSVLEAVKNCGKKVTVVQPIYIEPFPVWEFEKYTDKEFIVVEQSIGEIFADHCKKNGVRVGRVVKRYDGRPFDPVRLGEELGR